jgi:hypothetical protein
MLLLPSYNQKIEDTEQRLLDNKDDLEDSKVC